ncbi:sensor histidine kinase [Sedimentibacter hydroxybenzoicus DSM 7310]|uniref:histidine kinase n=1 Tax=Sedimentibacter hydroxybenzoicus DSM 7310 TaxID=1123245 RepID=A0A974BLG1_SEDHY|nr:sensor histidine kinase [Sedimentibacter hydroxybenzoicus]NYB75409.1 sensor histidine kinase [Sedimentibacter hydroxybenzoicus DSM 7310]
MIKDKKLFYITKTIIITLLFLAALYFENAQQQRLAVLISIFLVLIINSSIKYFIKNKTVYFILFILDSILIFLLEQNFRLLVNYFLHSFYIIILIEASITLSIGEGIIAGTVASVFSMIKFIYLVYFKFNISSFSQFIFFLLINVSIMIIAIFAQYNKTEKEKKDTLYRELLDTHKKLKEYTEEVRRLSIVEEKNKIARDIHDSLGHNMTALIMQLQMADHYLETDLSKSAELLDSSIKTAKDSLKDIREVVETLRGKLLLPDKVIQVLVDEFAEKTGTEIELNVYGKIIQDDDMNTALYHILQEGMTNAVRHGKAADIWIELNYGEDNVKFSIRDNGTGVDTINEGFGIKGIKERVKALNGNVEFKSENGFIISGFLSLNGDIPLRPVSNEYLSLKVCPLSDYRRYK